MKTLALKAKAAVLRTVARLELRRFVAFDEINRRLLAWGGTAFSLPFAASKFPAAHAEPLIQVQQVSVSGIYALANSPITISTVLAALAVFACLWNEERKTK